MMWALFIACHSHTLRYAATPIEVAVSKHIAKSSGVHTTAKSYFSKGKEVKDDFGCGASEKTDKIAHL